MSSSVCPLTNEPLPNNDPSQIAILYKYAVPFALPPSTYKNCRGHPCTLSAFIAYCKTSEDNKVPTCPGYPTDAAVAVFDKEAHSSLFRRDDDDDDDTSSPCKIICFRYGPQNFWLSVPSSDEGEMQLAQNRVREVLQKEDGLTFVHKGKIVCDIDTVSDDQEDVSSRLLELSQEDISKRKKPTLVVMGKKVGHHGKQGGHIRR